MIKKIRNSLTIKIFLITSALLALVCFLTYNFIAWYMPITYSDDIGSELDTRAQELTLDLGMTTLEDCTELIEQFIVDTGATVDIFDSQYNKVELPLPYNDMIIYDRNVFYSVAVSSDDQTDMVESSDVMSMEYSFSFVDSPEPYFLLVFGSRKPVNQAARAMQSILPWLVVTILCISILGSLFYARYVTRPIVKLSAISKNMSELEFDWHCDEKRTDEIGVLAHSLNQLSKKLSIALSELRQANAQLKNDIDREREIEQKRLEFFSAVSHELKTPITIIKGQLEGMLGQIGIYKDRDKYLARSLAVTGTMEDMVQQLLTISRMDTSGFIIHPENFDFSMLVSECLAAHNELFEQKELAVNSDIDPNVMVTADKAMIKNVVNNLISNAANYSSSGQLIYIMVRHSPKDVHFIIENCGSHIPEEQLSRLFEPFYRIEASRNRKSGGSGLGLYIVKKVLDMHEAEYKIENTAAGVQFTLKLKAIQE